MITEQDAVKIASSQFPNMIVTNTTTHFYATNITGITGNKQRPVWSVEVHGIPANNSMAYIAVVNATDNGSTAYATCWGGMVIVDAETGSIIDVYQDM